MRKIMSKKINIDIWRFIVSFLIVAIHISPFDKISSEFDFFFTRILGRIAVPLFLMITGYYILDRALKDKQVLVDYTKKILKIYLLCISLYLPINIYMGSFKNIDIITILKDFFYKWNIISFMVFSSTYCWSVDYILFS